MHGFGERLELPDGAFLIVKLADNTFELVKRGSCLA